MVNKTIKQCLFMCFCTSVLLFSGCSEKDYYDPNNSGQDPTEAGSNPSSLDFSTTQSVKINLNYAAPKGFVSVFDVYSVNPLDKNGALRSDVTPIAGGINVVGVSELSRVIPSYVTDLYVYSPSLFVPRLSYAKIENGIASFSQVDIEESMSADVSTRTIGSKTVERYLKSASDFYPKTENGHYKNDLINPDKTLTIPADVFTKISQAFPPGKLADSKYYEDATINIVNDSKGQGGAKVYVSVLSAGGTYNNSLSYFTYTGDKDFSEFTAEEQKALKVINVFKYADVINNTIMKKNAGLTPGKYAQLLYLDDEGNYSEIFPVNTKIGWVLHSNAYQSMDSDINYNQGWIYSTSAWNKAMGRKKDYTIFFKTTDSEGNIFNCFGFEDQISSGDADCNDVIFHVLTDPIDAVVPPPSIEPEDIITEETIKGILAFEDKWPRNGDYDLNDVVVKYNSTVTYTQTGVVNNNEVVGTGDVTVKGVKDVFSFIHTGAIFNNAFSYKVNIDPKSIKSVKVDGNDYDIVPDGTGFIIYLCPNVKNVIDPMIYGATPKVYTVEMEFVKGAVLQDSFSKLAAPYNPFISPRETVGAEIHLPMYEPTSKAEDSYFGTEDDRSDKSTLWYVSGENIKYPFAIHLSGIDGEFTVPKEEKKIYVTYPKYTNWIESNMTNGKDWYLHPAQ